MIEVSVNTTGLEEKILRLARYTHKSVGSIMKQEARLVGVQLARYTQPFGFGDDAKKLGEGAIARDTQRAFYVLPDNLVANPTPISSGKYAGWLKLFITKAGTIYVVRPENYRANDTSQTLFRHHNELRNKDGIVPKKTGWVDKQPDFVAINLWVISQSQYNAYLPFIQKEVGFAKAGWATAISGIGGTRGIPGWVTRHKNKSPGSVNDQTANEDNPTISIVNEVNYTSRVLSESGKRGAIRDAEYRLAKRVQAALDHPPKE